MLNQSVMCEYSTPENAGGRVMFLPLATRSELNEGVIRHIRGGGVDVLLIQSAGQVYIVANRCPHDGSALAKGAVAAGCIRCPKHRIAFRLDSGRALGGDVVDGIPPLTCYEPVWQGETVGLELP